MTKLCIDYPMKYTHLQQGDITFGLAQMADRFPKYEKALIRLKEGGREIMLDNGAWEFGTSMDVRDYIEIIEILEPTYAVIPDTIRDAEKSRAQTLEFFDKYPKDMDVKLIYAPQGKTLTEIIESYNEIANRYFMRIQILGVPKHIGNLINRVAFTDMLYDSADIKFEKVHFLGYWNYEEIMFAPKEREFGWYLHSIDTRYPVKYAYLPHTKFPDELDYYLTDEEMDMESFNIAVDHFYENLVKIKCQKK